MTSPATDRKERLNALKKMLTKHDSNATPLIATDIAVATAFINRIADDTGLKLNDMDDAMFDWLIGTPDKPGAIHRTLEARLERLREAEPIVDAIIDRSRDPSQDLAKTFAPPVFDRRPETWNVN